MAPAATQDHLTVGLDVIRTEAATLDRLAQEIDAEAFRRAVDIILAARAHIVVTGMGKSGHIAGKIAATLASTGTPAFFLHPAEAVHGDLGMMTGDNVLLALSHSGSTEEVLNLLPYARSQGINIIAVTGVAESSLAKRATVPLLYRIDQEACPLNLAPTASCIAQLAFCDALAGACLSARGFAPEDFAIRHPLGALGRRLQVRVADVMVPAGDALPVLADSATVQQALHAMTRGRLGAVVLHDEAGKLTGIFCDGDLRRLIESGKFDLAGKIGVVMIPSPRRVREDIRAVKAVDVMEQHRITVLPVVDGDDHVVGMVHLHMLVAAGLTS